jgi:DNA polymerase iota
VSSILPIWFSRQANDARPNRLQGFGSAIAHTVKTAIEEKSGIDIPERSLPIHLIREHLDQAVFLSKFGPKTGQRLWKLIHGDDEEPVNPSPEYPAQISVEDSHYGITSFDQAITELGKLCIHLLHRLTEDLTEDLDGNPLVPSITSAGKGQPRIYWAMYPTNLRLSIRLGYDGYARQSVSTQFPVDALDDTRPAEERAERLTRNTLSPMLKRLLRTQTPNQPLRITM